jgi:general secretion pathway protein G
MWLHAQVHGDSPRTNAGIPRAKITGPWAGSAGFTLLRFMVAVAILGFLVSFVGFVLLRSTICTIQRSDLAGAQLRKIEETLELYRLHNGAYPTTEQGLVALVREPSSDPIPQSYPPSGYLKEDQLRDPWGAHYRYEAPGRHNRDAFDLSSLGSDAREGGADDAADITNWELAAAR